MALFGIGKKKDDTPPAASGNENGQQQDTTEQAESKNKPKRSLRNRDSFLKHARTTADAHNFDYSLDMYTKALRQDPDNMSIHEELFEVAKRRKVNDGKPAKKAKIKAESSSAVDKMLRAEHIMAYDPVDPKLMLDWLKCAVAAHEEEPELNLSEPAHLFGQHMLEFNAGSAKPDKDVFMKGLEYLSELEVYDLAVIACKHAIAANPNNDKLMSQLKQLEAAEYGQNKTTAGEEGGFLENVKDLDKQKSLEQQDSAVKTEDTKQQIIDRARAAYDENPEDGVAMNKLVQALLGKQDADTENEAIDLLEAAFNRDGSYKNKAKADDVRMRQFKRQVSELAANAKANPEDANIVQALATTREQQLTFELEVFAERTKKYPTDMRVRYEYGRRLFSNKQYDEAIGAFQQSSSDAKVRARSFQYLGQCFIMEQLLDEAIDTLDRGIESHPIPDDTLGLDLRYLKMDALQRLAKKEKSIDKAKEAQAVASEIIQASIGYRDIKDRMQAIKALASELNESA